MSLELVQTHNMLRQKPLWEHGTAKIVFEHLWAFDCRTVVGSIGAGEPELKPEKLVNKPAMPQKSGKKLASYERHPGTGQKVPGSAQLGEQQ